MKKLFILSIATLIFASCSKDKLVASGDKRTETRDLQNFTGIKSTGANDIHITYGQEFKVTVRGSDNLIPYFKTELVGSTLNLGYDRANVRKDDIEVFVTLPEIRSVALGGSGSVDIEGRFPLTSFFEAAISGSGEIEIEDPMDADETMITISGSGEAEMEKLTAKRAEVRISGSGDAKLRATQALKAKISGSGKIFYHGNPQIEQEISGSGRVIKL